MTLLQYVCRRLLGPPAKPGGSKGESYWICPFHNDTHPSFHTLPHKPKYKDPWHCFGCGMRGDEADLLGMLQERGFAAGAGEKWPQRRNRLERLWRGYERKIPARERTTKERPWPRPSSSGDRGGNGVALLWQLLEDRRIDHDDLLEVVAELKHRRNLCIEMEKARRWKKDRAHVQ